MVRIFVIVYVSNVQSHAHAIKHHKTLEKDQTPYVSQSACTYSSAKRKYEMLTSDAVPESLKGLSPYVVQALALLEVDVGPDLRARDGGFSMACSKC